MKTNTFLAYKMEPNNQKKIHIIEMVSFMIERKKNKDSKGKELKSIFYNKLEINDNYSLVVRKEYGGGMGQILLI